MKRFEVIAAWQDHAPRIGVCDIESARGRETISFSFDPEWLLANPGFQLDPDLFPASGRQYPPADKPCFGFLSDLAPDRWGRRLMDRRERMDAADEKRPVKKLSESDYILGVHDAGRMGGIRLRDPESGTYVSDRKTLAAPPMKRLRELEQAVLRLEEGNGRGDAKWLRDLVEPASSLGGARPKANVSDETGALWIAKFPSRHDDVNTGAWEMVVHDLALLAGIRVPEARKMRLSGAGDTFLVKRFDRDGDRRVHFASAMTLLGQTDHSAQPSDVIDIAGIIEQTGAHPAEDLKELWMRTVFHICVSNTDNHLRNHAMILGSNGWRLSPSFDVNPTYDQEFMALTIGGVDRKNLAAAMNVSDYFRIRRNDAKVIAAGIQAVVREHWEALAQKHKIGKREQKRMKDAFAASYDANPVL